MTGISLNGDLIHNTLSLLYIDQNAMDHCHYHGNGDCLMCAKTKSCNAKDGSGEAEADVVRWCGD